MPSNEDEADLRYRPIDATRAQAEDHDTTGPHDAGEHRVVEDWDLKTQYCIDCGATSPSKVRIEAEPCEVPDNDE